MIKNRFRISLAVPLFFLATFSVAHAQYSGGSGTAEDPYRIAAAADLMALGTTRGNLTEHYILTADIDLDPNLPGRTVFDKSVIGRAGKPAFSGVFDGGGHTIAHLTIVAEGGHLGLFGVLAAGAEVKNLGVVDVNITGSDNSKNVGGLVGFNEGVVTTCYSTGVVTGNDAVGGLVGINEGVVTDCHSGGTVTGVGAVPGTVGGLVGRSEGHVIDCYSGAQVAGLGNRGGLVGHNAWGTVLACYSTGAVSGGQRPVRGDPLAGGLVGDCVGVVTESF